jgi:lipopolysaccharide export system protein LptA
MKNLMFVFFTMCFASVSFQAQATNTFTFTDALKVVSDTTALVEYKGKYVFGDGVTIKDVTIVIEKEGLFAKSAEGDFALKPIKGKADSFTVEEISAEITFTRDNNKKITGLSLTMSEGTVPAKKEAAQ